MGCDFQNQARRGSVRPDERIPRFPVPTPRSDAVQTPSPSTTEFLKNLTIAVVDRHSQAIFVEMPTGNPSERQTAFTVQEAGEVLNRNYDEIKESR